MRNSDLIDALPDSICVVSASGDVLLTNKRFRERVFMNPVDSTVDSHLLNFAQDILHAEHRSKFFSAVEMTRSKLSIEDVTQPSISLRFSKTLLKGSSKAYPVYHLIHWTMSATSNDDCYVLVGRDPDPESAHVDREAFAKPKAIASSLGNERQPTVSVSPSLSPAKRRFSSDEALFDSVESMTSDLIDFFQNAPIALHWLSSTGHILWANKMELSILGYSSDEYIGHELAEFLMPGEHGCLLEIVRKITSGLTVNDAPIKFKAKNGDTKYFVVDTNVNFNKDGSFKHTRCFLRPDKNQEVDKLLSEVKKKLVKKHAKSKATFIRDVFHEIRTPMHVLSSFFSDSDPSREDFEDMKHHTGIVDDLTFSTAFEAGEVSSLYPVPTHLPTVLAQVVDAVNAVEQKAGGLVAVKLHCNNGITNECEDILADPFFHRVLFGLLSNAVKFSPSNGVVDLTVSYVPHNGIDNNCSNKSPSIVNDVQQKNKKFTINNDNHNNHDNESNVYDINKNENDNSYNNDNNSNDNNGKLKIIIPFTTGDLSSESHDQLLLKELNESINKLFQQPQKDSKEINVVNTTSNTTSLQSISQNVFDDIDMKLNDFEFNYDHTTNMNSVNNENDHLHKNKTGNEIIDRATRTSKVDEGDTKSSEINSCNEIGNKKNNSNNNNNNNNISSSSSGTFTFHFRNNTIKPMDLEETKNFFKYYNHAKADTLSDYGDLVPNLNQDNIYDTTTTINNNNNENDDHNIYTNDDNKNNYHDVNSNNDNNNNRNNNIDENNLPMNTDQISKPADGIRKVPIITESYKNRRRKSSSLIPCNFSDLKQYEGLGLGLYTAHNMVNLMGGKLECSSDDNEACFWFTLPSSCISTSISTSTSTPLKSDGSNIPSLTKNQLQSQFHLNSKVYSLPNSPVKNSHPSSIPTLSINKMRRRKSRSQLSPATTARKLFSSNPPVLSIASFEILSDGERGKSVTPSPSNSDKINITHVSNIFSAHYNTNYTSYSNDSSSNDSNDNHFNNSYTNNITDRTTYNNSSNYTTNNFSNYNSGCLGENISRGGSGNNSFCSANDIRVLVVDDSRICQKVANRALTGHEFKCTGFASNGQEAVDMLSVIPLQYDAVLMDLRMPVMDGLTAIRKCREELRLIKLPIIALTAEVGISIKEEAMKAGASWFLSKPTKSQELVCVLRALALKQ